MMRCFALFFECLSRLPDFGDAVAGHYRRLLETVAAVLERGGAERPAATRQAREIICRLECGIYLSTVLGGTSQPKAED